MPATMAVVGATAAGAMVVAGGELCSASRGH